jgi:predicted CXXCH cytochrome family protein
MEGLFMVNSSRQYPVRNIPLILAVVVCSLFLSYTIVIGDETDNHCDYSSQLADPSALNKYRAMKAEMELIARVRKESLEAGTSSSHPDELTSYRQLDEHSRQCIGCHELKGRMAIREIIEGYYPNKNLAMASIYATHAIGTDYVAASIKNGGLRKVEELPTTMTLISGRIACITCHDPLNPRRNSLAVDTNGGALCFACHTY